MYDHSGGNLVLYGNSFAYTTLQDECHYIVSETCEEESRFNLGKITEEFVDHLDMLPDFNFNDYDINEDGYVDYIYVILRNSNRSARVASGAVGFSMLGFDYTDGAKYDGVKISSWKSGAYHLYELKSPHIGNAMIMYHEIGHNIWNDDQPFSYSDHLLPVIGNEVPYTSMGYPKPDEMAGYMLMSSSNGPSKDVGSGSAGFIYPSAFERFLINRHTATTDDDWITCLEPTGDQAYTFSSIARGDDCLMISLTDASRQIFVSNVQADDLWAGSTQQRYWSFPVNGECATTSMPNLFDAGLLAELGVNGTNASATRRDILPADNGLQKPDVFPFARLGHVPSYDSFYDGDLYGPGSSTQLTPWTRPNISGYTFYPSGWTSAADLNWPAVDSIAYVSGVSGDMRFDFIEDFRTRPTVRSESWITIDPGTITGPLVVRDDATLHLQSDLDLTNLAHIHAGARLAIDDIDPGDHLDVFFDARLLLGDGASDNRASLYVGSGHSMATQPFSSVDIGAYGFIEVAGTLTIDVDTQITFGGECAEIVRRSGGNIVVEPSLTLASECACVASEGGGSFTLADGASLDIENGAFFASLSGGRYTLGAGSTVELKASAGIPVVEPGARFDMASGSELRLRRDAAFVGTPAAPLDFDGGAIVVAGGQSALGDADLSGTAVRVEAGAHLSRFQTSGTLVLGPGFEVEAGGTLHAYVGPPPGFAGMLASLATPPAASSYSAAPSSSVAALAGAPALASTPSQPYRSATPTEQRADDSSARSKSDANEGEPEALTFTAEAYPNPFSQMATVRFVLPEAAHVRLVVYDALGHEVARLVDAPYDAGEHDALFDGAYLPSGSYFYRLNADDRSVTGSILLVR
jgi:hypothetical protein